MYYDVTRPLRDGMMVWPGDPPVSVERVASADTDGAAVSRLTLSSHAGTHVDAPAHVLSGGLTVDAIPADVLLGPAYVVQIAGTGHVTAADLEALALPDDCARLLIGTRNSASADLSAFESYTALTADAARWLVARGLWLVGVDGPSVDSFEEGASPVHHILLGAGVTVVEGLDLSGVPSGRYDLFCLPVRLAYGDGAPARVLLRRDGERTTR
ncbi:MAG TPA: cyclase family protein [Chloroflexi bacterium]|nr:cyclase family protein [Chloroflexota bacterium]